MTADHEHPILPAPRRVKYDLTGQVFGRLTVVGFGGYHVMTSTQHLMWVCICACGTRRNVNAYNLRSGKSNSCGCRTVETTRKRATTHGGSNTPEYRSFRCAKERCLNPNNKWYFRYGGRGIEFRFQSFEEFIAHMGPRPPAASLDRIKNDGHYEPGNVKWGTPTTQANNRRTSYLVEINGVTKTLAQWCGASGDSRYGMAIRRLKRGWCGHCAITLSSRGGECPHTKNTIKT